jgi:hypothetical protein
MEYGKKGRQPRGRTIFRLDAAELLLLLVLPVRLQD